MMIEEKRRDGKSRGISNSLLESGVFFGLSPFELLLVVLIVAVLGVVLTPQLNHYREQSRAGLAQQQLERYERALALYNMTLGRFPSTQEGLRALMENLRNDQDWRGPYIEERDMPKDPWGQHYVYRRAPDPQVRFVLLSMGPDGREGTDDDITI